MMTRCAVPQHVELIVPFRGQEQNGAVNNKEQDMPNAVIEDWGQFSAFLAAQPLCQWSAQKQQKIAAGLLVDQGSSAVHASPKKDDNADLIAALSSMA